MFNEFTGYQEEEKEVFYTYDSKEDIEKCLHCEKEECDNCLKHKNFV